jgi:hypothetical protein
MRAASKHDARSTSRLARKRCIDVAKLVRYRLSGIPDSDQIRRTPLTMSYFVALEASQWRGSVAASMAVHAARVDFKPIFPVQQSV